MLMRPRMVVNVLYRVQLSQLGAEPLAFGVVLDALGVDAHVVLDEISFELGLHGRDVGVGPRRVRRADAFAVLEITRGPRDRFHLELRSRLHVESMVVAPRAELQDRHTGRRHAGRDARQNQATPAPQHAQECCALSPRVCGCACAEP